MSTATAIVGARIFSDAVRGEASAVAFRDGEILAVGGRDEVLAAAGDAEVLDAGGATVLPGFVDAHHHVSLSVLYGGLPRLLPPRVTDVASLQTALARASRELPEGRWLVAMDWDEAQLDERRPPTRAELDEAVSDRPVFALHYTCHRALANSRALELAGIDRHTPDPSGGVIARGRGGVPNGLLVERGMSRVEALARPDLAANDVEGFLERIAAHYRRLVEKGITRVCDTAVPIDLLPLYREAVARGHVLVPTHACPVSANGYLEAPWDVLEATELDGAGMVQIGPVKLVLDGAPGCSMCLRWGQSLGVMAKTVALAVRTGSLDPVRTSLSVEPRYGTRVRTGIAIYRRDEATEIVRAVCSRGFGVAAHAIGNEAVETVLDAYQAAGPRLGAAGVPRIEHGAYLDRELVRRIAGGGYAVVCQPSMLGLHVYASAVSIPGLPFKPLRWLLDAGARVAFSSDYPVTDFDPLTSIRLACTRTNARGVVVDPDQRIGVDEAVRAHTRGAAEACGALDRCGTLEPGKRADLVVIDGEVGDAGARVRTTIAGGRVVYGRVRPA